MKTFLLIRSTLVRLAISAGLALAIAVPLPAAVAPAHASLPSFPQPAASPAATTGAPDPPVVVVGVAASLNLAGIGWPQVNSVQLAVDQVNAAGGIDVNGTMFSVALAVADDQCNPAQAVAAANALLAAGAVAVVGHSCSGASMAAAPVYGAAGVAMVSPSATGPQLTQQGLANVFRTVPHDGSPGASLGRYFGSSLHLSRSAIVEGGYQAPGDAYASAFAAAGGVITSRRTVADTSQFTATLTTILAEQPDAIANFTSGPDPAAAGGQFSRIAHSLGFAGIVGWNSDSNDRAVLATYANAAGAAAAEHDYAAMHWRPLAEMPGLPAFVAAYQAAGFPHDPTDPGPYGPFAYDAAKVIIAAIDRANSTNPAAVRTAIAATHDHRGVVGTYQGFDAHGDVVPQWGWLESYHNGQWTPFHPGRSFLPLLLKH